MTGWRVEVSVDEGWFEHRGLEVQPFHRKVRIETFRLDALWGIGRRWCALVDWGETVQDWLAP